MNIDDIKFDKKGLVPVIIQDHTSKEVLTLAYANRESIYLTVETSKTWLYSRSRDKLWMKGEESGNIQTIRNILIDCDKDAVIYQVDPAGPACHKGTTSCFHE